MSIGGRVALGAATGGWSEGYRALSGMNSGPNFGGLEDMISQRRSEIEAFSQRLDSARNNVLTQYKNLQANTMARFAPALEASLAGRGLGVGSGAFASAIAHEATGLQAGYDEMNTNLTEKNLYDVENLKANMFAPAFQVEQQKTMLPYQNRQALLNAFGGLAGTAVGAAIGGPGGAMAGKQVGQSVFGGAGGSPGPWNSASGGFTPQDQSNMFRLVGK